MTSSSKFGSVVVACSLCTSSVFMTNMKYDKVQKAIEAKTLTDVLFRTSVCERCERKMNEDMTMLLGIPGRGGVVPVGTLMVTNWPTYKRVSMYIGKYCKLYVCNDSGMHAMENRFDVLGTLNSNWNMYDIYCDDAIYMAQESGSQFFK